MQAQNTFKKFCPNVFVARCPEQHEKGEVITLTTRYGKEVENTVHNFLGKDKEGFFLYSITRVDGLTSQERAKRKAERLSGYADNATNRSEEAFKKADLSEKATGIVFGQPILVGHHSERRHRKTIERAENAMNKSIEESKKAEDYARRAEYWAEQAEKINLSMPESLEFFRFKLEEAEKRHRFLKDNPEARAHSYSLTYAKKAVNDLKKKVTTAVILWGEPQQVNTAQQEKVKKAESEARKSKKVDDLIDLYGGFFAFNRQQLEEGYNKAKEAGHLQEGEKIAHIRHGLYIPSKNVDAFIKGL